MQGPEQAYDAFLASTGFGSPPAPLFGSKGKQGVSSAMGAGPRSGAMGGEVDPRYAGPGEQKFADVYQQGSAPGMPRTIPGTDSMMRRPGPVGASTPGQINPKSALQPRPPGYAFPSGSVLGQKSVFAPGGPGDSYQDNYAAVGIWGDMHAKSAEAGSTFKPHSEAAFEKRRRANVAKQLAAIEAWRNGGASSSSGGKDGVAGRGNATGGGFPSGKELVAKFAPSLMPEERPNGRGAERHSAERHSAERQGGVTREQLPYVLGLAFFLLVFVASGIKWSTNRENKSWLGASVASFVLAGGSLALYLSAKSRAGTEESMHGSVHGLGSGGDTFVAGGEPIGDDRVALMGRNMPQGVNPLQRDQRNVVPYPQPTDLPTDFQQRMDAQGTDTNLMEGPRAHLGYRRGPPTPDGRKTLAANKLMRSPGNNNMDAGTFNEFMRRLDGEAPNQFYQAHPYMTFAPQFENRSQIDDAESVFGISTQPGQMLRQSIYREPKIQQAGAKTMHLKDPPPGSVQPLEKVHPWLQKDESGQEPAVMMATPATSTIGRERLQGHHHGPTAPMAPGGANLYHPAASPGMPFGGSFEGRNGNAFGGDVAFGAPRMMQAAKTSSGVDDLFELPSSAISSESKLTPQDAKTFEMERLEESRRFEGTGRQGDRDFLRTEDTASSRKNALAQMQAETGGSTGMGFGETGPAQQAAAQSHGAGNQRGSEFQHRPPLNEAQQRMGPPPEPIKVGRSGTSVPQDAPLPSELQPVYQPETPEQAKGQVPMGQVPMGQTPPKTTGGGMHGQNDDGLGSLGEVDGDDGGGGGFFAAFAEKKQPTEDDIAKAQLDTRR